MQFFPCIPWEFAGCSIFCKKCFGYKIHDIFHFKSTLFCIIYLCVIYSETFSQAKSRFLRAFFTILGRSDYVTSFSSFSICIENPAHLGIVFSFLCLSLVQWLWRKVSSCKSYKVIIFPSNSCQLWGIFYKTQANVIDKLQKVIFSSFLFVTFVTTQHCHTK